MVPALAVMVMFCAPPMPTPVAPVAEMVPVPLLTVRLAVGLADIPNAVPVMVPAPVLPDASTVTSDEVARMPAPPAPVAEMVLALLMVTLGPLALIPNATPEIVPVFVVRLTL